MPLRDDLLNPIPGDNPSGVYVRHDTKLLLYDKIKEARRQDDALAQGDWQHERKLSDFPQVSKLAQEALATRTKDLQLAAWLTEALLQTEGFAGLRQGLDFCTGLLTNFWDTLYPPVEDGDLELRAGPLEFLGTQLDVALKSRPLAKAGYDWFKYKESRAVGYEDQVKNDKERKARQRKIDEEKKLAPEVFDKAFAETPKAFYWQGEKDLDACLQSLKTLDELCDQKFGSSGPALGKLKASLEEVRHAVHALLEKKRETEPDPVEVAPAVDGGAGVSGVAGVAATGAPGITISVLTSSEPAERREAIATVARVAALLRQQDPKSPAPYLMMRGLRWGELRGAQGIGDAKLLEAPPTELRQHIKRLALGKKWNELLEAAENAMSLPCSRAWLDLQRLVVGACTALGEEYEPIAAAVRSELRALLNDIPQLLDATLLDDTPAANLETRAWLQQIGTAPASQPVTAESQPPAEGAAPSSNGQGSAHTAAPTWLEKSADAYALAQDTLRGGQPEKAFEIMRKEIARQRSGRGRFERTLQLVELCVAAGKDTIAQPLLDDLAEAIETHKLDDWEDKEMVAAALATIMRISKRVQDDESEKRRLFERICRLDPVRALSAG
ncbi:MAG TPA: type VI secretion system protein TssA [Terriglobales bacterium]|nr:type VI secretion system protein TssA [Terriglobales bacterium]